MEAGSNDSIINVQYITFIVGSQILTKKKTNLTIVSATEWKVSIGEIGTSHKVSKMVAGREK